MVWSLLNRYAGGRDVLQAPLPVRQVRTAGPNDGSVQGHFSTIEQDLLGYAFYSTLRDLLEHRLEQGQGGAVLSRGSRLLEFTDGEIKMAAGLHRKFLAERVFAFEMNYIRVRGLISALQPFCQFQPDGDRGPWWLEKGEYADSLENLRRFVGDLESVYTGDRLNKFKLRVSEADDAAIETFLRQLPAIVDQYRADTLLPLKGLQQAAEDYVRAEFATGPLTCLGTGEEGVVLTDGRLVYKYFHYWKAPHRADRVAFLQSLVGRVSGYKALPDLLEVRERGEHVVVVYPYEKGG